MKRRFDEKKTDGTGSKKKVDTKTQRKEKGKLTRRPFFNSLSFIAFFPASSLGMIPNGSKPKFPGSRSNSFMLLNAARVHTSAKDTHNSICFMEESSSASWASMTLGIASKENCSPGTRTNSGTTSPTVASMACRPCLSSASRNQLSHSGALFCCVVFFFACICFRREWEERNGKSEDEVSGGRCLRSFVAEYPTHDVAGDIQK